MSTAPRVEAVKRDWGHDETGCTVLHIDMDAFYASLEIARNPELSGKPVIIGIGTRSVVSAANYEARKYGVNSAMAVARAKQLCPDGVYLPVDMPYYRSMSRRIFSEVFSQITDNIEQVSVDEGYMEVSSALLRWKSPTTIAEWIRAEVFRRYHITCSVGIAANKLVAKMASTNAKPDGLLMIPKSKHAAFVQMMPLRSIAGIGPSLEKRLNAWGIDSVHDLAELSEETLARASGSTAAAHHLYLASHGLDERPVTPRSAEKSIGSENTFMEDTRSAEQVSALLRHACDEVASSLRKRHLLARTITVKLRFADLSYSTKSHTVQQPFDTASVLYPVSLELFHAILHISSTATATDLLPREIRLAGVSVSGLQAQSTAVIQPSLEDLLEEAESKTGSTQTDRMRNAEKALDAVRQKYGSKAAGLGL